MASVYDFEAVSIDGKTVPLAQFRGKPLLIVNTASQCGLTPQLQGMEWLYKRYKERGLVVLGFPCNQFLYQDRADNQEIQSFCMKNYGVSFPMFEKIDVNGDNTHPLYEFLKSQARGVAGTKTIKWNFTKFLVDANGRVVERFAPATRPEKLVSAIENLLDQAAADGSSSIGAESA